MDQLRAMRVFAKVVEESGFARAARALDMAPAVVTRVVAELEDQLGARLLNRTTRSVALTEIGEQYLEKVRAILQDVEEADALAGASAREPRGHLRVLCPPAIAVHLLAPQLPLFHARAPQVTVEITAPGPVETVDETFDISLFSRRDPPEGEFIARRLARSEVVVCASPAYLNRRGRPQHPGELSTHDTVVPPLASLQRGLTFYRGPLDHPLDASPEVDRAFTLKPARHATLATTHIDICFAAARAGLGIAGLPSYVIGQSLQQGDLERVLPDWRLFDMTIWAGLPSRRHLPARTRAFLDFLLELFGGEDRDPWLARAGCPTRSAPE